MRRLPPFRNTHSEPEDHVAEDAGLETIGERVHEVVNKGLGEATGMWKATGGILSQITNPGE